LVPIFAIVQAINILTRTFGTLFRVNEKSKYILMSKFGYVIFLIALGIPLIKYLALNGAVICMLGSTIIEATICCIIFRKHSIERPLEFANQ
jgi:Na+-driven multidrug efflux pump